MNEATATATAEVKAQETAEVKAAAPIKAEVPKLGVKDIARLLAEKTPLAVKESETDVYQVFTTKENGKLNWRKGLIYQAFRYAKGLVFEFQLYSAKQSAHLAGFKNRFDSLVKDGVIKQPKGLASRLTMKIEDSVGMDEAVARAAKFVEEVEVIAEQVRAELPNENFVSKAETKALEKAAKKLAEEAAKANAPATDPVAPATQDVQVTDPASPAPEQAPKPVAKATKKAVTKK